MTRSSDPRSPPSGRSTARATDEFFGERKGWDSRMLQDQRAYERVAMRAQVTCIVDSHTSRGVSGNLSQGGMQVEASDLKAKEAVQLSFRLPLSGVAVDVVGVVAWGDEKRHGIQFTYMGAQSRQSILQYIREQMER